MKERDVDFDLDYSAREMWTGASRYHRDQSGRRAIRRMSFTFTPAPLPRPKQPPQENPTETPDNDNPGQNEELSTME